MLQIISGLLIVIYLSACGSGGGDTPQTNQNIPPETTTVSTSVPPAVVVNKKLVTKNYTNHDGEPLFKDREIIKSTKYENITNSDPDMATGLTTLSFIEGTFSVNAKVYIYNLSTRKVYNTLADSKGALTYELFAPAGSDIFIRPENRQDSVFYSEVPASLLAKLKGNFDSSHSLKSTTGEEVRFIPGFRYRVTKSNPDKAFYTVNIIDTAKGSLIFSTEGNISKNLNVGLNEDIVLSNLRVQMWAPHKYINATQEYAFQLNLYVEALFDEKGNPLPSNASHFLSSEQTPTALHLSLSQQKREFHLGAYSLGFGTAGADASKSIILANNKSITFKLSNATTATLPDKNITYALKTLINVENGGTIDDFTPLSIAGEDANVFEASRSPMCELQVGANSNQEPMFFFMDNISDGYLAAYDRTLFKNLGINLMTHIVQGKTYIKRYHPSGDLKPYSLEPFLPNISLSDRNQPSTFTSNIDIKNSNIHIVLTKPDGSLDDLGSKSLSFLGSEHAKNSRMQSYSAGGVHITDVLQLKLKNAQNYSYIFDQTGEWSLQVSGTLAKLNGKEETINQSISFRVVDDLITPLYSTLPMTPLLQGEKIRPSLTLFPAVPADVNISIISPQNNINKHISGKANSHGVFISTEVIDFAKAGEYRVDIEVNYNKDGVSLGGSRTFGSVIAETKSAITTGGLGGIDNFADNNIAVEKWFTLSEIQKNVKSDYLVGTGHVRAPLIQGDVEWVREKDAGVVRSSMNLNKIANSATALCLKTGEQATRTCLKKDTLYPMSQPTANSNAIKAYSYQAAERFAIRVRESIGDIDAPGYWRFDDEYAGQRGMGIDGDYIDLPKFQFIGTVVKDYSTSITHYEAQSSLFVLVKDEEDSQIQPPFQGKTGTGIKGPPLFKFNNRDVDAFIMPTTLMAGSVIRKGTNPVLYAQVAPTLNFTVDMDFTLPDGTSKSYKTRANRLGFMAMEGIDFTQVGIYKVKPTLTFEASKTFSDGNLISDFVTSDALLSTSKEYLLFVSDTATKMLPLSYNYVNSISKATYLDLNKIQYFAVDANNKELQALTNIRFAATAFMDGWILTQEDKSITDLTTAYLRLDIAKLKSTFNVLDTKHNDLIQIRLWLEGKDANDVMQHYTRSITLDGEKLLTYE